MKMTVLASGSKGNTTYIETKTTKILIDCGISYKQLKNRSLQHDLDISDLDAIMITHEHHDHVSGLNVTLKHIPATTYLTEETMNGLYFKTKDNIPTNRISLITPDEAFTVGDIKLTPFSVSHDANDAIGFIIHAEGRKIVFVTDIGYLPAKDFKRLENADVYIFEANYDVTLLFTSARPFYLKQRIDGVKGHMSNNDSAYNMTKLIGPKTKQIILIHPSKECNTKQKVLDTYQEIFEDYGMDVTDYNIIVASQDIPTPLVALQEAIMTNNQIIQEVCSDFFKVSTEEVVVLNRLMGGMSNYTYVIEINQVKYTFRIPGKNAERFVDRDVEVYHIDLIDSLGLNNNTIFLDTKTGYKIAKYIKGTPLNELDPLAHLEAAAVALHRLHDSGLVSEYDYDPLARLATYEQHTKEYNHVHSERYNDLKNRFLSYKDTYIQKERYTVSHGDSQVSNFIKTDSTLKLVDWEFTGNNDPFYDIACFGNTDFNHALQLLPVYLGKEPTTLEYNRLYFYRSFQCLQWHNVALYKEFIGLSVDLGVDFMFVANLYLDKAEGFLNKIK